MGIFLRFQVRPALFQAHVFGWASIPDPKDANSRIYVSLPYGPLISVSFVDVEPPEKEVSDVVFLRSALQLEI